MSNPEIEIVSAKIVSSAGGVPTWEVAYRVGGTPATATVIAEDELTARLGRRSSPTDRGPAVTT